MLEKIREAERNSHIEIYSNVELYNGEGWLQKPIKTVLELIPLFQQHKELRVLDLGGGVGRNCLPFAREFCDLPCVVECVDILELAIEKLKENAEKFGVIDVINGILSPIEAFEIKENSYDLIMAISALEHIDSKDSFAKKLSEIGNGIRKKGIVCLVINSSVTEKDKSTGTSLFPQFEVNLPTEELQEILKKTFADWEILKSTVCTQQYDIPRVQGICELRTNVVTLVARKE